MPYSDFGPDSAFYTAPKLGGPSQHPLLKDDDTDSNKNFSSFPKPIQFLKDFATGKGINLSDETGSVSFTPQQVNIRSNKGFNFTGDFVNKGLGFNVPATVGGNKGSVGLQGNWNSLNPSIQANFAFGQKPFTVSDQMSTERAQSAVLSAISPFETPDPLGKSPELSAREQADQSIEQWRSSGGRDPNNPATWWKGY